MSRQFRWAAVIPSAIVAWFVALFIGMALNAIATKFCPADHLISGHCKAPWFSYVDRGIILFSVALSAVLTVVAPAVVAPTHRVTVAWVAFVIGAVAAIAIGWGMAVEIGTAIGAGMVVAMVVSRVVRDHDA